MFLCICIFYELDFDVEFMSPSPVSLMQFVEFCNLQTYTLVNDVVF